MNFGISLGFLATVIGIYVFWQIRQLLLLLFTAIVLATVLNILVKKFENWQIKRYLAIPLSLSLLLTVIGVFIVGVAPPFVDQLEKLIDLFPVAIEQLEEWENWLILNLDPEDLAALPDIKEALIFLERQLQPLLNQILGEGLSFFLTRPKPAWDFCSC